MGSHFIYHLKHWWDGEWGVLKQFASEKKTVVEFMFFVE